MDWICCPYCNHIFEQVNSTINGVKPKKVTEKERIDYGSMTVAQLKELLKDAGKPTSGKKVELIERLNEVHEKKPLDSDSNSGIGFAIVIILVAGMALYIWPSEIQGEWRNTEQRIEFRENGNFYSDGTLTGTWSAPGFIQELANDVTEVTIVDGSQYAETEEYRYEVNGDVLFIEFSNSYVYPNADCYAYVNSDALSVVNEYHVDHKISEVTIPTWCDQIV